MERQLRPFFFYPAWDADPFFHFRRYYRCPIKKCSGDLDDLGDIAIIAKIAMQIFYNAPFLPLPAPNIGTGPEPDLTIRYP